MLQGDEKSDIKELQSLDEDEMPVVSDAPQIAFRESGSSENEDEENSSAPRAIENR